MGLLTPRLRDHGAEVAAIAVTATFSQQAFAEHLGVDFPLLSDWDREVCASYGVRYDVWKGHSGLAKRAVFVIDDRQVVRYAWHTDDALQLPDLDEVMACVEGLRR